MIFVFTGLLCVLAALSYIFLRKSAIPVKLPAVINSPASVTSIDDIKDFLKHEASGGRACAACWAGFCKAAPLQRPYTVGEACIHGLALCSDCAAYFHMDTVCKLCEAEPEGRSFAPQ